MAPTDKAQVACLEQGKWHSWLLLLLAMAGAFLLYGHLLGLSFFADDLRAVWRASSSHDPSPIGFFRPLSDWSIRMDHYLFGVAPEGYRAFNVMVHGFNVFLVVVLLQRLVENDSRRELRSAPYIAGLLFLCYPFHNEALIWIVGRGASMATLFALLALLTLSSNLTEKWKLTLSTACLFLGLLAYESAFLIPALAVPILVYRKVAVRSLISYAVHWSIAIGANLILRHHFAGSAVNEYGSGILQHGWANYIQNVPKALGRLFLPPDPNSRFQLYLFITLLFILNVVGTRLWRRTNGLTDLRKTVASLAWMIATSMIVAIVAGVSTRTSESDRFLYMPSAFLCMLLAVAICILVPVAKRWIAVVPILLLSMLALFRNDQHWVIASHIIERTVAEIPAVPVDHRLFISGLPSDTCGAFIFRNGFYEAMLLSGRDTSRMIVAVHVLSPSPGLAKQIVSVEGDTLSIVPGDMEFVAR